MQYIPKRNITFMSMQLQKHYRLSVFNAISPYYRPQIYQPRFPYSPQIPLLLLFSNSYGIEVSQSRSEVPFKPLKET